MGRLLLFTNLISIALLVVATQLADSFIPPPKEYPAHSHKTLLLDRDFDSDEVAFITMAALEWSEVTHHVVDIDVIQLPNHDEMLTPDSVIVNSVSPDSPDILIQESIDGHTIFGLRTTRSGVDVIEIVSERISDKQYKEVVLHEIGHVLGLDHIEGLEGVDTLMCPYIEFGADHITAADLHAFCKLYPCHWSHN